MKTNSLFVIGYLDKNTAGNEQWKWVSKVDYDYGANDKQHDIYFDFGLENAFIFCPDADGFCLADEITPYLPIKFNCEEMSLKEAIKKEKEKENVH